MRCNSAKYLILSINKTINKSNQSLFNSQSIYCLRSQQQQYHQIGRSHFHSFQDNKHSFSVLKYIYQKQLKPANKKYACFLLNITDDSFEHFERHKYIWNEASLKLAVDGSANCLAKRRMIHTVDVVCGDFDSIDAKLIEELRCPSKSSKFFMPKDINHHHGGKKPSLPQVIETPNQKETDFTKAIRIVISMRSDIQFFFGLYNSSHGERIDHLFGLVNTLHLIKKNIIVVNVRSNTFSWLLPSGISIIEKSKGRELCSLVPFTGLAEVKTKGLVYNIGGPLNFGGLISTSNICSEDCENIVVDTNRELLWSIDV